MKILIFDCEHREGMFKPWDEDFVLSCVQTRFIDAEKDIDNFETLWFEHKNIDDWYTPAPVECWKRLQGLVDNADIVCNHNLKHDIVVTSYLGGINFENKRLWCTMVVDYLIHGQDNTIGYGLDEVAERRGKGNKIGSAKEYWDTGVHTEDIPHDFLQEYAEQDVRLTGDIFKEQLAEVEGKQILKIIQIQNEFILSLAEMEMVGLKIDVERALLIYEKAVKEVAILEQKLKEIFGDNRLNLQSNDHLSAILYGGKCTITTTEWVVKELKSKPESKYYEKSFDEEVEFPQIFEPLPRTELKKKGFWKTDKITLSQLRAKTPLAKQIKTLLNELSIQTKIKETLLGKGGAGILNKVASDGSVHTTFNNAFTTTGRLSSSSPNVMNLPREGTNPIKEVVIPHFDGLFQWDLSQIEWRDAAFLSQDPVMIHEINTGIDQHIAACVDLMELPFVSKSDTQSKENRDHAKVFNFRMIYGGSFWGFFLDPKMPAFTKTKWKAIIEAFFQKYKGLYNHNQEQLAKVWENNGKLEIFSGRRFTFHKTEYDKKNGDYIYPENAVKNWPIQGNSGGDILPMACVIIRRGMRQRNMKSKMILTVHDSIVFDYVDEELQSLTQLCMAVTDNLTNYISSYFGINWNVNLGGECEYGKRYANLSPVAIV